MVGVRNSIEIEKSVRDIVCERSSLPDIPGDRNLETPSFKILPNAETDDELVYSLVAHTVYIGKTVALCPVECRHDRNKTETCNQCNTLDVQYISSIAIVICSFYDLCEEKVALSAMQPFS